MRKLYIATRIFTTAKAEEQLPAKAGHCVMQDNSRCVTNNRSVLLDLPFYNRMVVTIKC